MSYKKSNKRKNNKKKKNKKRNQKKFKKKKIPISKKNSPKQQPKKNKPNVKMIKEEDPFGDTFDQEPEMELNEQSDELDFDGKLTTEEIEEKLRNLEMKNKEVYAKDLVEEEIEEELEKRQQIYVPKKNGEESVELEVNLEAYELYFVLKVEWPCLSFDFLKDDLGIVRSEFPMTTYMITGTQSRKAEENSIMAMKLDQMYQTKFDQNENPLEDEDPNNFDDDPLVDMKKIPHIGTVNRIRSMPQQNNIVAAWSDQGQIGIYNLKKQIDALDHTPKQRLTSNVLFQSKVHKDEGYALTWSPNEEGRLLSGDCTGKIYLWLPHESTWVLDEKTSYQRSTESIEDLTFSPNEGNVFASCSVDRTIKIWDSRAKKCGLEIPNAHNSDVNVISWNKISDNLIASGGDDGIFKVWDLAKIDQELKYFQLEKKKQKRKKQKVQQPSIKPEVGFVWHSKPITSLEWNPFDETEIVVASEDNQITIWDISLEKDEEIEKENQNEPEIPPQLLFIHQGQKSVKEVHWHPQIPGLLASTASDGFNLFLPINLYKRNLNETNQK
ncbi:glutamate-rich wd repeat-containing protein [Anaeramoeba flamelloides]|uniref:Glutamate-rich WD repeat-containing protein 1 n=1 Tax=Anaeramoeba flamelloides TaxID=1746091 RepID=A0ABQ8YG53_9EUKA|nr:glutamate-rich wd repeat-containing protein [Anaeramoeba flamelloides]